MTMEMVLKLEFKSLGKHRFSLEGRNKWERNSRLSHLVFLFLFLGGRGERIAIRLQDCVVILFNRVRRISWCGQPPFSQVSSTGSLEAWLFCSYAFEIVSHLRLGDPTLLPFQKVTKICLFLQAWGQDGIKSSVMYLVMVS